MPANWAQVDALLPTFLGNESAEEQIRQLQNYMVALTEQIKYAMRNLDATNWNAKALEDYSSDAAKPILNEVTEIRSQARSFAARLENASERIEGLADLPGRMTRAEDALESTESLLDELTESGLVTEQMLGQAGGAEVHPGNLSAGEMSGVDLSDGNVTISNGKRLRLVDAAGNTIAELKRSSGEILLSAQTAGGTAYQLTLQGTGGIELTTAGDVAITAANISLTGSVTVNGAPIQGGGGE